MRLTGIMKSSLEEKEEILSTTPNVKNFSDLPTKENRFLFNHTDTLAADHDVSVSNTMIKVTYKKALKDHYVSFNGDDFSEDSVLVNNDMNFSVSKTDACSEGNSFEASECMLVPNEKWNVVKEPECHSSGKQNGEPPIKRKKEIVNGLSVKVKNLVSKDNEVPKENSEKLVKQKSETSPGNEVTHKEETQDNKLKIKRSIPSITVEKKLMLKSQKNGTLDKNKKNVSKTEVNGKSVKRKLVNNKERGKRDKVNEENLGRKTKRERHVKKPILFVDPELPSGWSRYIRIRDKGTPDEKHIVYVVSPMGKKFRFKWKLRQYLLEKKSKLDADQFFFGLYERGKPTIVPGEGKKVDVLSPGKVDSDSGTGQVSKSDIEKEEDSGNIITKELLLHDPDLPFGWKRIINSNGPSGKLQVHIISPEGRIFRRKYRLNQYLKKHQYTHSLDRFYFGLYPKKDANDSPEAGILGLEPDVIIEEEDGELVYESSGDDYDVEDDDDDDERNLSSEREAPKYENRSPMYNDPNLPEGWKRYIKVRSSGETAGRMEVVILSPDGRKLRTKKQLEHYFQQHNLDYSAEDFDFSVFGKTRKSPEPPDLKDLSSSVKKRFKPFLKPVPSFDVTSFKEQAATPERRLMNAVSGLTIGCDLSTARGERRSRLPRREHEKLVRKHLESEDVDELTNGCDVPEPWIQRLIKCRSNLRTIEPDAVSTIAEKTKDFIKEISRRAFESSEHPEEGLRYEDVANLVENSQCLSPLKTIIPQKITYKKFLRLNRPQKFFSFT